MPNFIKGDIKYSPIYFRLLGKDGQLLSENVMKPYPKDSTGLQVPNLEIVSVTKLDFSHTTSSSYKSTFQVELQTDSVAQYVWLEAIGKFFAFSKISFNRFLRSNQHYMVILKIRSSRGGLDR